MNPFEAILPPPHAVLYLANVALAALLSCAAALLAAFVWPRRSPPTRYGLLLLGLALVLTSPGWVWLAGRAGIGRLQVTLSEARDSRDELHVVPDTLRAPRDAPQQPQVPETAAVRERFGAAPNAVPELPIDSSPKSERPAEEVVSPSRPPPAASLPWWWSIAQGVALVWAVGTAVSLAWLLYGLVRLAAFCRGLRPVGWDSVPTSSGQDPSAPSTLSGQSPNLHGLRRAAAQAAAQVGLVRPPGLFISAQTMTPVTFGLCRPAVVLPENLADLASDQLHAVLLHEMAHVARRDPWVGLAQRLAAALY